MGANSAESHLCQKGLQWGTARKIKRLECGPAHFSDNSHVWRASIRTHSIRPLPSWLEERETMPQVWRSQNYSFISGSSSYRETWGASGQRQKYGKAPSALSFITVIYKYSEDTTVRYLLCIQGPLESLWLLGLSQLRSQPPSWKFLFVQSQMSPDAGQEKKFWEVDLCTFLSHYCTHLWERKRGTAPFRLFQKASLLFHYNALCKHVSQMMPFHFNV